MPYGRETVTSRLRECHDSVSCCVKIQVGQVECRGTKCPTSSSGKGSSSTCCLATYVLHSETLSNEAQLFDNKVNVVPQRQGLHHVILSRLRLGTCHTSVSICIRSGLHVS